MKRRDDWGLIKRFMVGPRRASEGKKRKGRDYAPPVPLKSDGAVDMDATLQNVEPPPEVSIPEIRDWRGGPRAFISVKRGEGFKTWRLFPTHPQMERLLWWQDEGGDSAGLQGYCEWVNQMVARSKN